MKISIKLSTKTAYRNEKGYPVVVYLSHNYQEKLWRTGHFSQKAHWNSSLAMPTSKHPNFYLLGDFLKSLRRRIEEVLIEHHKNPISIDEIRERIFNENRDFFYLSALNLFEEGYRGTDWSAIRRFDKFYPHSTFNNVTREVVVQFRDHLLKLGNKPSGVDSYIRSLKALWNRLSNKPNPFKGVITEIPDTVKRVASHIDLIKLIEADLPTNGGIGGYYHYRNYWLLMFYLGGIDPEVLAKLRYDRNLVNGRIVFNRDKGRSKTSCSNIVPDQALEILNKYKSKDDPYFVPIYLASSYKTFSGNFSRRLRELSRKLDLSVELRPKSARYTFIDRAQQLLIDERITAQIVGHKRKTTTSIYTNDFPQIIQDESHVKIISN